MKTLITTVFIFSICTIHIYTQQEIEYRQFKVNEINNTIFTGDKHWRGADGAASVDLENGKILWLFSDTFIDKKGTGKRSNATMIRNSIAIQEGYDLETASITFFTKGSIKKPDTFFEIPGSTWFWTGHGIKVNDKLIIFLIEEIGTKEGFGFEAIGWYIAIIDNPNDNPDEWNIRYVKGPETFGIIVGSSAILKDSSYIYAYGVKEPATHEVYLLRFDINSIVRGEIEEFDWWINSSWTKHVIEEPKFAALFIGQTEFSIHYQPNINKYIQFQTFGFGHATIGYRLADQLQGPWSDPIFIFKPDLGDKEEFVYSANAHPELISEGIIITYNINNFNFGKLINNESIYFPKVISIIFEN